MLVTSALSDFVYTAIYYIREAPTPHQDPLDYFSWVFKPFIMLIINAVPSLDKYNPIDLLADGRARELVHRIQNVRREMDLDYAARISIGFSGDYELTSLFESHADYIKGETLATALEHGLPDSEGDPLEIDGHKCSIKVTVNP